MAAIVQFSGSEPTMTTLTIPTGCAALVGELMMPTRAPHGLIVFAHGSGSNRLSPRNREVAEGLVDEGFAALLFDLLTREEALAEQATQHLRFDIPLLAERLIDATEWVSLQPELAELPLGMFGSNTGAAAALIAASRLKQICGPEVRAIVSRGGRPDLAGASLRQVCAPTLLIAGGDDIEVVALSRLALAKLVAPSALHVVPEANHQFEEPGAMRAVTDAAVRWFRSWFTAAPQLAHG